MKKRLNLITVFLALAFCVHLVSIFGSEWYDFASGFEDGYTMADKERNNEPIMTDIYLTIYPEKHGVLVDSVYNSKTNTWLPNRINKTVVTIERSKKMILREAVGTILALPLTTLFIVVIIRFVNLIMAINKSIIFDRVNIRRLRFMGFSFILFFVVFFFMDYTSVQQSRDLIEIPGYYISGSEVYSTFSLMIGIICLMIGEVFAIGLRLKEEQDLTI